MGLEDKKEAKGPFSRNITLPLYDDFKPCEVEPTKATSGAVSSAVESCVRSVRLGVEDVADSVTRYNNAVAMKYNTAKAHTYGVLDFFRDEPAQWQRYGIVAVAGLTGFISAYRRGSVVKVRNMVLSAGVAGTVCWPQQTVQAASIGFNYIREPVVNAWTEYAPGSPYWPKNTAAAPSAKFYTNTKLQAEEDHGQSLKEDKDMYSTRGS